VTDLPESISSALHLLGVGVDGEVALGQVVELLLEDDGAGLLVCLKQGLDGDPQSACILCRLHGEVEDGVVDGAVYPAANAGVRLGPQGVSRARSRRTIDVAEQPVLAAESGEERRPLGVVGALEAEGDGDVLLDVDGSIGGVEGRGDGIPQGAGVSGAENAGGSRRSRRGRHDEDDARPVGVSRAEGGSGCAGAAAALAATVRGGGGPV
jgi:hypothetical protein